MSGERKLTGAAALAAARKKLNEAGTVDGLARQKQQDDALTSLGGTQALVTASIESAKAQLEKSVAAQEKSLTEVGDAVKEQLEALEAIKRQAEDAALKVDLTKSLKDAVSEFETETARLESEKVAKKVEFDATIKDYATRKEEAALQHALDERTYIAKRDADRALEERAWKDKSERREAELAAREKELTDLRAQVAQFPETLKNEISKTEKVVSASINKEAEHKAALLAMETKADKAIQLAQIKTLEGDVSDLKTRLATMTEAVTKAQETAAGIAKEAISSAGSNRALSELQAALPNINKGK